MLPHPNCKHCPSTSETSQHTFVDCPKSSLVWTTLNLQPCQDLVSWVKTICTTSANSTHNSGIPFHSLVPFALWGIWNNRNRNLFENNNKVANGSDILMHAMEYFHLTSSIKAPQPSSTIYFKWNPPDPACFKLNTDGAFCPVSKTGGIGGVIRNHLGHWIRGFSKHISSSSIINSELQALFQGLKMAKENNLTPLVVECDSKAILQMVKGSNNTYANLLIDCRLLIAELCSEDVGHIFREANFVADLLAKNGCLEASLVNIMYFDVPPTYVCNELLLDSSTHMRDRKVSFCSLMQT